MCDLGGIILWECQDGKEARVSGSISYRAVSETACIFALLDVQFLLRFLSLVPGGCLSSALSFMTATGPSSVASGHCDVLSGYQVAFMGCAPFVPGFT